MDGLYLGNYYVKEITPPTGYLVDEEEHDLVCNYEGDLVAEVKRDCLSLEQVMKQPFQIIKAANNGKTDADLLKGAGFTAYLVSSLKVKEDGSYDFDSAKPVVIGENGATEIFTDEKGYACSIAIPSLTDGKELEGAKLQVTDESGKVVDSWTSGKEAHIIKELVVGQKYTLTETKPADGYVTAESITFTVEDTAKSQKIEMKDDVTKVEISKTDISGKELPGAKLTILDKDGKTVENWTSEEKPHYIEMLPIGEYTLREESAPDGYLVAEDVKFTVEDTGEIQKVVMKDEVKPEETPTPETPSTQVTDTPKTGDDTHMLIWILLAIAGMAGSVSAVWITKKRK